LKSAYLVETKMIFEANLELHTALAEDASEGCIWFKLICAKDHLSGRRRIVRVTRTDAKGRSMSPVYCEGLYADRHYAKRWLKRSLAIDAKDEMFFVSEWYRLRLGIDEDSYAEIPIRIETYDSESVLWQLRACLQHPQIVVFIASILGIVGTGLGLIGLGLVLIAIKDIFGPGLAIGILAAIAGLVVTLFGIIQLLGRNKLA